MKEKYGAYINGQWVGASDGATFDVVNPANGQVIAEAAKHATAETDE